MAECFMARAKRNASTGVYEKGLEVRTSVEDAKQGFHAYMAAYAYGHDQTVDRVQCMIFDQTNMVTTIANITQAFNEQQKFPEMDAYCVSKIYADWTTLGNVADTTVLTVENVLDVFDTLMLNMDNARVPVQGRILYVTIEVKKIINNADKIYRSLNVETAIDRINRTVNRLDEVEIIGVPASLMKTLYVFDTGWAPAPTAAQINMFVFDKNEYCYYTIIERVQ